MFKATLFCSAVLMLLSGTAFAVVVDCPPGFKLQLEDFNIGAMNSVTLIGSVGTAASGNVAMIVHSQNDWKLCSDGQQNELVIFAQNGDICAYCGGTWNIGQEALVAGGQMQLIGDGCDPKIQMQSLGVGLGQAVTKIDGTGAATAVHDVAVIQNQAANNSAGGMNEGSIVLAGQVSSITGGPCTTGQATSGLTVGTTQTQMDI
jgi:hypothetical protein